MLINESIERIVAAEQPDLKDVIRLAVWVRFSASCEVWRQASIDASAFLVEQETHQADVLFSESELFRRLTADIITSSTFTNIHKGLFPLVEFSLDYHYRHPGFHIYSAIADIVHFLLWFRPETGDKRDNASLNKAYWYVAAHGFRGKMEEGWKGFLSLWSQHRNAAAFIYAAEYLVDESWIVNPLHPTQPFRAQIDPLCNRDAAMRLLSAAKAVEFELRRVLHPRALASIQSATLPPSIEPALLEPIQLRPEVYVALGHYEGGANAQEDDNDYAPEMI